MDLSVALLLSLRLWSALFREVSTSAYSRTNQGLTAVPTDIPRTATSVDLKGNAIHTVTAHAFANMTLLKTIRLNSNNISVVDPDAFCGSGVQILWLNTNSISRWPDLSCIASQLRDLRLNSNHWAVGAVTNISLDGFDNLRSLDAGGIPVSGVDLGALFMPLTHNITYIRAAYNGITGDQFGINFQNFSLADNGNFDGNQIGAFHPDAFSNWPSLTKFKCYSCSLYDFPQFQVSQSLRELTLSTNSLTYIPVDRLDYLSSLTDLDLSNNPLAENISTLFLWKNRSNLKTLDLSETGLTDQIMSSNSLSEFSGLVSLDLSRNNLGQLPNLTGLQSLESAILSNNGITTIPAGTMDNLNSVIELDLTNNNIADWADLEGLLGAADTLQRLVLDGNPLASIDETIWQLAALQELELSGTSIGCFAGPADPISLVTLDLTGTLLNCSCLCWLWNQSYAIVPAQPCSYPLSAVGVDWLDLTDEQLGCTNDTVEGTTSTVAMETSTQADSSTTPQHGSTGVGQTTTLQETQSTSEEVGSAATVPPNELSSSESIRSTSVVQSIDLTTSTINQNPLTSGVASDESTVLDMSTVPSNHFKDTMTTVTPLSTELNIATERGSTESSPEMVPLPTTATSSPAITLLPPGFVLSWNTWLPWSECTRSCDEGSHFRLRLCQSGNGTVMDCAQRLITDKDTYIGYTIEVGACNTHNCPVDGVWGAWSDWSECRVTCGEGIRLRSRDCDGPYHSGEPCENISPNEVDRCEMESCEKFKENIRSGLDVVFTESDRQPLNQGLGGMAIGIIVVLCAALFICDVVTFKDHVSVCLNNIRPKKNYSRMTGDSHATLNTQYNQSFDPE